MKKNILTVVLLFLLGFANGQVTDEDINNYFQVLTCYPSSIIDIIANVDVTPYNRNEIQLIISNSQTGATISVDGDNNIVYTPAAGFTGFDVLGYNIKYPDGGGVTRTRKMLITVMECPGSINTPDCWGEPESFEWSIKQDFISKETNISTYVSPMVADLDGDGIPEILVARFNRDNWNIFDRIYDGIYIYWGHDRANPTFKPTVEGNFDGFGFSVAKVKIGGVLQPIIVMFDNKNGYLYAYDPAPAKTTEATSRIWKSSHPLNDYAMGHKYNIGFVDFDGDGEVEIYSGGRIFDATTGTLLVEVPAGGNTGIRRIPGTTRYDYYPIAADINNDGKAEYIAGTEVYSVHITNRTGTAGNSMTLIASIPAVNISGSYTIKDGATVVVDINGDGRLDVVVSTFLTTTTSSQYAIIAWDVQTQTLIAKSTATPTSQYLGFPLIGNIDDEPNLEIVQTAQSSSSAGRIDGFRWDGNKTFNRVYTYPTSDVSGATGITLFDFNQDNVMELVYRDETHLRIMQANRGTGTFTNLYTTPATSGTAIEYPVVADADGDGAAEIVVTGGTTAAAVQGSLRIYKSGNQHSWAPARKVWNQYAYNVLNINEDLTVPQYLMNPARFFPNGKQPFNNFLQQQTSLNTNGDPYWTLSNIVFTKEPKAIVNCDSVIFTGCISNKGDAALQAPIYVTFYKNNAIPQNIIAVESIQQSLPVNETLCYELILKGISIDAPSTDIWISINDRNGVYPYQAQCEVDGRRKIQVKPCDAPCTPPTVTIAEKEICQNNSIHLQFTGTAPFVLDYTFNGTRQTISVSGKETVLKATQAGENTFIAHSLVDKNGCAADFLDENTVKITVNPIQTKTVTATICAGETYLFNGNNYNQTGVYSATLPSLKTGCDSIVTLNLTVTETVYGTDTQKACGSYTWIDGITYTASNNTATRRLTSVLTGCDSIVTLNLTIYQTHFTEYATICDSDFPFTFRNVTFDAGTVSGDYVFPRISTHNCDSIVTLKLTVNPTFDIQKAVTICENELPYTYYDTIFEVGTQSGIFILNRKTRHGCDSTVRLDLTVNKVDNISIDDAIFVGEGYNKHGFSIPIQTAAGTIRETRRRQNQAQCDSLVHLTLKVRCALSDTTKITDTIFVGKRYNKHGFLIPIQNTETTVFDTLRLYNRFRCDSTVLLKLKVICPYDTLRIADTVFVGERYNKHGFSIPSQSAETALSDTLRLHSRFLCDSTVILNLKVILNCEMKIPNVFTPNGDGINDIYLEGFELCFKNIVILNRWGQTMYEGTGGWDGRQNGVQATPGTYFYIVTTHSGKTRKGALVLLRE